MSACAERNEPIVLMAVKGVADALGVCTAMIYKLLRTDPEFPKPITIGSRGTAASLHDLAALYQRQRRHSEAEPLYREALLILRQTLGDKHFSIAVSLNDLATACQDQGKHAEAEELLREALKIYQESLGKNHPDTATSLHNLALLCSSLGKQVEAEVLLCEALSIHRRVLGDKHPVTATSLHNLASLYQDQGKYAEAEKTLLDCRRSYEANRLLRAKALERSVENLGGNPYPSLAVVSARLGKSAAAFTALEMDRGRGLLDEQAARQGAFLSADELKRQRDSADRLTAIEPRLLKLFTQGQRSPAEQAETDTLVEEHRKLEYVLADLAVAVSVREVADCESIQKEIPNDTALIAWVDVTHTNGRTQEHWACVLHRVGEPEWIPLPGSGDKQQWTWEDIEIPRRLRAELRDRNPNLEVVNALAKQLYAQRLAPLKKHLESVKTLYIVGSSQMAGIPVELLTDSYTISYVPSGTFLARRRKPLDKPATILALGDPVFSKTDGLKATPMALPPGGVLIVDIVPFGAADKAGLKAGEVVVSYGGKKLNSFDNLVKFIAEHADKKEVLIEVWREGDGKVETRKITTGRLGVALSPMPAREAIVARRKEAFEDLPGTQVEVAELEKLFGKPNSKLMTRSEASEQSLDVLRKRGELKNYRYLHFATHGLPNNNVAFESRLILSQDRPKATLAVAGEPLLDNSLSAREVLEHWKLDADLVTLSACESGLGQKAGGDGLLGFAQAFLVAGSRSVCLSLWKVDDAATTLLMDRFYQNLLGKRDGLAKPMPKAEALREAKEWLRGLSRREAQDLVAQLPAAQRGVGAKIEVVVRKDPKSDDAAKDGKPFAHPRFWAAFILIGDPN